MSAWSFFDPQTGLLKSTRFSGTERLARLNTPPELRRIAGSYDHLSQRVDVEALASVEEDETNLAAFVVDYQPDKPDDDHEFRAAQPQAPDRQRQCWRWVKKPEVLRAEALDRAAREQIAKLELSQLRPMRELLVDPLSTEAKERLSAIDAEIAALRPSLKPVRSGSESASEPNR